MTKYIDAKNISAHIKPNARVFIQGGVGEPKSLISALAESPDDDKKTEYVTISIPGINAFSPTDFHARAELTTFFLHNGIKTENNRTHFHPLHYRDIYRYLEQSTPFDIALIQVSPPDEKGLCSLGVSVDFVPAIINRSKIIIAEINQQMPAPINSPTIHMSDIHFAINNDHALIEDQPGKDSPVIAPIADHVTSLIDNSSCIQLGIGKLPSSILSNLQHHRNLGLHGGLISESAQALIENGVINGKHKTRDTGQHIAGIALGSQAFYQWVAQRNDIVFKPVNYTHDLNILSTIDQFVSINSALEVDLLGQANAEMLNHRQISATGGLVDFIRGARYSKKGKSILALPSTALGNTQSKIKAELPHTSVVSVCRADIDHVVTEHGIASLFGQSLEKRAQALINIAAPDFRDALWSDWEKSLGKRV